MSITIIDRREAYAERLQIFKREHPDLWGYICLQRAYRARRVLFHAYIPIS